MVATFSFNNVTRYGIKMLQIKMLVWYQNVANQNVANQNVGIVSKCCKSKCWYGIKMLQPFVMHAELYD